MKILALDSTGKTASVAIIEDNNIIGENFINTGFTHSQTLMPLVSELLKVTNTELFDIDKIAVTVGPGSFTGIRIGVSTVKGMAFAEDKECVPLSTLEVLAEGALHGDYLICPVMDARRGEVYNALFECKGNELVRIREDRAIAATELLEELICFKKAVYLVGDGADLCMEIFGDRIKTIKAAPRELYQRALAAAFLAKSRAGISAEELRPTYLRLSQAEREAAEKNNTELNKGDF